MARWARNLNRIALHMGPEAIRTHTLVRDVNAIKLAVGTDAVNPHDYTGATLDGVLCNPGPGNIWLPMTFSVSTTAAVNTYNITDPIIWTYVDENGDVQTYNMMLLNTGGNELATSGALPCTAVNNIHVPIQLLAGGQFEFGVEDIYPKMRANFRSFTATANGNIGFLFEDGSTDILPVLASAPPVELTGVLRVLGATTTAVPLKVLYDHATQIA